MKTVITDNGITACLNAGMLGPKIEITKVRIGSQIIDITPDMTDVAGLVWEGNADYIRYQIQESDVFAFKITLDESVGDFDVGNIGLYLADGTLFSITVMDKPERKIKNAEDVVGNRKIFVVPIKLAGISELINVSLLVPDESSIPFVQTQNDLPQVNLAAFSVYEIINHTDYNASALALRTPTKWVYIVAAGSSGYVFPATMFADDATYGSLVYYSTSTMLFECADGLDSSKGYLGIRNDTNNIVSCGTYYDDDLHLTPGTYYYADGNANAGKLTTTPNNYPVGYAPTANTLIMGAMPESIVNKTQTISINNPTAYKYPSEAAIVSFGANKADVDLQNTNFITDCCISAPNGVASVSSLTLSLPAGYEVLFSDGRDSANRLKSVNYATLVALTASIPSSDGDYSVFLTLNGNNPSLSAIATSNIKYETGTYTAPYYRKDNILNKWYYCPAGGSESEIKAFIVWQGIVQGSVISQSNPVYPINILSGGAGAAGGTSLVNVANEAPFKQMVINWMMPDYSAGVSISSGWVANKLGWVVARHGYDTTFGTAYVNGVIVFQAGADSFGGAGIFPVNIGDTVTSNHISSLIFYPCKGA